METYPGGDPMIKRAPFQAGGGGTQDELKEKATKLTQTARGRAMGALEQQKGQLSSLLDKVAQSVEGDKVGGYVADLAHRGSDYLRGHSADEIFSSASSGVRSRPAALVGASFLVGFAAARLFRR
jgi:hypothetical protein